MRAARSPEQLLPQLVMTLDPLPASRRIVVPAGYAIRSFTEDEGDAAAWERIIATTFGGTPSFSKLMSLDAAYRAERVLFACLGGTPVATASAWNRAKFGMSTGYLHMVAVMPEHEGRGLGTAVSVAVLNQFILDGRDSAVLETDDFRLAAIKVYLRLGFLPRLVHENQRSRWRSLVGIIPDLDLSDAQREAIALRIDGPIGPVAALQAADRLEMQPFPYTPEMIRDAMPVGSSRRFVTRECGEVAGGFLWEVLDADAEKSVIRMTQLDPAGSPLGQPESRRATWVELRNHATFARNESLVSEAVCTVAAGTFDCWRYSVRSSDGDREVRSDYYFAKNLPGAPIRREVYVDDTLNEAVDLVEYHRP